MVNTVTCNNLYYFFRVHRHFLHQFSLPPLISGRDYIYCPLMQCSLSSLIAQLNIITHSTARKHPPSSNATTVLTFYKISPEYVTMSATTVVQLSIMASHYVIYKVQSPCKPNLEFPLKFMNSYMISNMLKIKNIHLPPISSFHFLLLHLEASPFILPAVMKYKTCEPISCN